MRVGDKVKIRKDLVAGRYYSDTFFASGMEKYRGKTATITYVYSYGDFDLDIDGGAYYWTPEMFEQYKPVRPAKPVLFIAVYDEVDRDPAKTFTSRTQLNKWLKEAVDDEDIIFDSIVVYDVSKARKPHVSKKVSLRKI